MRARHSGYDISQRCRKRIEEIFGWIVLALAAYNLIRLPKLLAAPA